MSIEVKGLTHIYSEGLPDESLALEEISFRAEDGQLVGLIGHTGSGKSTLVQHLNGLLKPKKGHIIVGDVDITAENVVMRDIRRKIGLVFQYPEYQLFEETVAKDVAFGPSNLGLTAEEVDERVREAIELVGLDYDKVKNLSPFDLSGGQKRRAAIAGVIAMKPEVLILDEPTNHLDMRTKDVLKQAIRDFNGTVILVSHDREFLDGLVSKVYEFGGGQVREHLGGIYDFLESRKLDSLRELEQRATVSKTEKDGNISKDSASSAKSEDSKLSYGEQKEFARRLRKAEKVVADIESEIAGLEKRIAEVEEKLATPDGAADTSLYELHGQLKKQLDDVMWKWSEASEVLDKLQK